MTLAHLEFLPVDQAVAIGIEHLEYLLEPVPLDAVDLAAVVPE